MTMQEGFSYGMEFGGVDAVLAEQELASLV